MDAASEVDREITHREYDGVGRAYRQYYPLEELRGRETTYNRNVDSIAPQVSQFDHRDRSTRSTLQDGTELTDSYTLGSGGVAVHTRISAEINSAGSGLRATTSRSTDGRGRIVRVDEPNGVFATYDYDAVNQLLHVTHSGNSYAKASVVYDLLGRRLSTTHPSTGTMQYVYDDASNLLRKVTQKLANSDNNKAIRYQYEFERLTHIFYPTLDTNNTGATAPQYDVQYVYGDASSGAKAKNQAGRMMRVIEKAVGEQRFEYGPAGELVRQVRILSDILSTNDSNPQESRWFETRYRYDTWNRIQNMSYPDGEVLSYGYDSGGLLQSLSGQKGSMGYAYVNHRNYDKFGQMRYLALGDLSETEHQYDAVRNRLQHLTVSSKQSAELAELLKLQYSYDPMSNIVKLVDNKSSFSRHGLGGRSDQTFSYDANMRLRAAQGNLNVLDKGQALQHSYWLVMAYDTLQRIALKSVATITNPPPALLKNYALSYQYEDRSKPYQVTRMEGAFAQSGTIAGWNHAISPEYDDNGNLTRSEAGQGSMNLAWDDENRLIEVKNESGDISRYRYGHDGERAIQQTPDGQTLYVNPNFTVRSVTGADGSQSVRSRVATKHIFVGSERIATKRVESSGTKLASNLFNRVNCAMPANSVTAFLVDVFKRNAISCPNLNATDSLISDAAIIKQEKESYFYHSDHLGSVGIVTRDGELYDYAIFLPFGEQWVFQSQNSAAQNQGTKGEGINPLTPFQFTGKELDKYTGLTYFGARYYDPHTSLWLSPDPLLEDYLSGKGNGGVFNTMNLNLYAYTYHNPMNLVDPSGMLTEKEGAAISADVYGDSKVPLPDHISQVTDEKELNRYGLSSASMVNKSNGFTSALYKNHKTGELVYAIRGSDGDDKVTNIMQALTGRSSAYDQGVANIESFAAATQGMDTALTGHSMGGGIAADGGNRTGLETKTYNAAGVHSSRTRGGNASSIDNYHMGNRDILTSAQKFTFLPDALGRQTSLTRAAISDGGSHSIKTVYEAIDGPKKQER